jgi:predicted enzyme related to lactoylglutathione lyase
MSRVQLALNVDDLEAAIVFYSKLFNAEPAKRKCRFPLEVAARMALTWVAPDRSVFSLAFVSH